MNEDAMGSAPLLLSYGEALRRRAWIVVLCVLLGAICGLVYIATATKIYTSSASVLITSFSPRLDSTTSSRSDISVDTEAELVKSEGVAQAVQKEVSSSKQSLDELVQNVSVTAPPNTVILEIGYSASTPDEARLTAQAFADSYLTNRGDTFKAQIESTLAGLNQRVTEVSAELKATSDVLGSLPPDSAGFSFAQARQTALTNELTSLRLRIGALSTSPTQPGRVIRAATTPSAPSAPAIPLVMAASTMLGLLAGVGAGALRERMDRRIYNRADLERHFSLPLLTQVPSVPSRRNATTTNPQGGHAEAFLRHLRNALVANDQGLMSSPVLVTNSSSGIREQVGIHLALAMARSGDNVALICADVDQGTSAQALGINPKPGLSDVLMGKLTLNDAWQRPKVGLRLAVLAIGSDPQVAEEQFSGSGMQGVVRNAAAGDARVVIEGPAMSSGADSQTLAMLSGSVLLVVQTGRTTVDDIEDALRQFSGTRTPVAGVVLLLSDSWAKGLSGRWRRRRARPGRNDVQGPDRSETFATVHAGRGKERRKICSEDSDVTQQ